MSPPNTPGIPGIMLPRVNQETVRKRANSHGDSDPPIEIDEAEPVREREPAEDFGSEVQANYGKGRFSGPAWAFLVACALAACVAITYFVTRNSDGSRPPQDEVLTAVNALNAKVDKIEAARELHDALVLQRIGALETQNGATQARLDAVLAGQGRLPQPVNFQVSQALQQQK